jgi:hypothetical protein
MSLQNIDRDYSLKTTPVILNTNINRNKDADNIIRLMEF